MRRAFAVIAMLSLVAMLGACTSSSNNNLDTTQIQPLVINLFAAVPASGPSPLRVTLTTNISGGKAPFFYSWDFTNDGASDRFLNNEFQRTVSVQQDYFARASDPGGVSQYEAVMKVMDSEGTVVTSDPVTVVVGVGAFTIDPAQSLVISDEPSGDGYIFRTGKPVYFIAKVIGGTAPFRYQWDFNGDGAIDSTLERPQYTWVNEGPGVMINQVRLTVVDHNDVQAIFDYIVPVVPPLEPGEIFPDFAIIMSSSPAAINDTITLEFDPTGASQNAPLEPQLTLSVIVDPTKPGKPPYEYYWDFQNDGAFDSQKPSPTIPYYDSARKVFFNPYLHSLSEKTYTLRCMVIDSAGKVRTITRTVISKNISQGILLNVTPEYGVTNIGGAFIAPPGVTPPVPYAQVADQNAQTTTKFNFTISGSTGIYQYQFDANGDGTPEVPASGWQDVAGGAGTVVSESFTFAGVGYFPARVKVRSVDTAAAQVDATTVEMPISLVVRNNAPLTDGSIKKRYDHGLAVKWTASAGGGNGQFLASREICIIGGAQGSTPIRDVERVVQTYAAPAAAGQFEQLLTTAGSARLPLNQERRGSLVWSLDPSGGATYYSIGGDNLINGILASSERSPGGDAGATLPWTMLSEIRIPAYYPLKDAAGVFISGTGLLIAGGLHVPSANDNDNVNGKLLIYDPGFDAYGDLGKQMITERYDASAAFVNSRLYIIGGRVSSGQSVSSVDAFNMNTSQWELAPSLQDARSGAVCQVIGGRIYVIGGAFYPSDESQRTLVPTAEVFNPLTGTWSYTLGMPLDELADNAASAAVPGPGSVNAGGAVVNTLFQVGGNDANGELNRMTEFIYLYTVAAP